MEETLLKATFFGDSGVGNPTKLSLKQALVLGLGLVDPVFVNPVPVAGVVNYHCEKLAFEYKYILL